MPSKKTAPPLFGVRTRISAGAARGISLGVLVLVLGLWFLLTLDFGSGPMVSPLKLPWPLDVLKGLVRLAVGTADDKDNNLFTAILVSARRITIAFMLCIAVSVPLGVAMGAFEAVNRFVDPIIAPLRFTPMNAFVPLFIVWMGIDELEKVGFLFFATVVFLLPVVVDAVRAVPEEMVQTAQTLGASRWQIIRTVLVPAALPQIFDGFRVMNGIAWGYILVAEMVNSRYGIGKLFDSAWRASHSDHIIGLLLVVGLIGLISDSVIGMINRALFSWRETDA